MYACLLARLRGIGLTDSVQIWPPADGHHGSITFWKKLNKGQRLGGGMKNRIDVTQLLVWIFSFNLEVSFYCAVGFLCPIHLGGGIKRWCCLTSVCLTSVAYIGPKSRTERPRKTKFGTNVAHVTRDSDTTIKVRRSKVKVTEGGGILWRPPAYSLLFLIFIFHRWEN